MSKDNIQLGDQELFTDVLETNNTSWWPDDIYTYAENEAIHSQLPGRQDGPADAYRHILAAGEAVRQGYPEWIVRSWGSFREWGDPPARAAMDRHNNDLGIVLGGVATSQDDLLRKVRNAIDNGGLEFNDSWANWRPESEWKGNPKNDNTTEDTEDRLPTDQTNWPPQWQDGLSPDDPTWWHASEADMDEKVQGQDDDSPQPPKLQSSQSLIDWLEENNILSGNDLIDQIKQQLATAAAIRVDPLTLDLDGDGVVETTAVSQSDIHFDHDNNGFAEQTGWVSKDDGLLVLDKNHNQQIDDGSELFGNHTRLADGSTASHGFEALQALDDNADGQIDQQDEAFAQLNIWQDTNQNGQLDAAELLSLEEAGIQSLQTAYQNSNQVDGNNNAHRQQGAFTKTNGTSANLGNL